MQSLYVSILQYLRHKGIAGATVSRAIAGYGPHEVIHTTRTELLMEHLPLKVEFIDSAEKVDVVLTKRNFSEFDSSRDRTSRDKHGGSDSVGIPDGNRQIEDL
jgi:PII-like signaling protein